MVLSQLLGGFGLGGDVVAVLMMFAAARSSTF
jgi:hypothetical protein